MKCLCFALVSLAVTGDIKLSVGETILSVKRNISIGKARRRGKWWAYPLGLEAIMLVRARRPFFWMANAGAAGCC